MTYQQARATARKTSMGGKTKFVFRLTDTEYEHDGGFVVGAPGGSYDETGLTCVAAYFDGQRED